MPASRFSARRRPRSRALSTGKIHGGSKSQIFLKVSTVNQFPFETRYWTEARERAKLIDFSRSQMQESNCCEFFLENLRLFVDIVDRLVDMFVDIVDRLVDMS